MTQVVARPPYAGTGRARSAFGWSLLVLAGLLVVNSLLGPLVLDVVDYPISASMTNQLLGLEIVTLVLVVPWMGFAGVLAVQHDPRAPVLALGPTGYTAYMFVQYVVGPEYGAYSWAVLLHLGIFTLAGGLTLSAWSKAQHQPVPPITVRERRWGGAVLVALAGFVLLRYLPAIVGAAGREPIAAEFREARTFFWSIVLLDLGIVVPLTVAAAVGLLRDSDAGRRALYGVVGWFALVPPSVAAMAAVMLVRDDPYASVPALLMLSLATLAFWAAAGTFLGRFLRAGAGPSATHVGPTDPAGDGPPQAA